MGRGIARARGAERAEHRPTPGGAELRRTPANENESRLRDWITGTVAGVIALAALVAGSAFGAVHASSFDAKLIAWISAAVILLAGVVATSRLSVSIGRLVAQRSMPSAGGAVRMLLAGVGYLAVVFSVLSVLAVSIEHLLVGAGLAGVVLGIAAQQSLGNVFAGLVLIMARPFSVGDRVRIRSGALGGIFDAWIEEMSLAYVTLRTDDGQLKIPNAAMLAAGIGQLPRTGPSPPVPTVPTAPNAPAAVTPAAAPTSGADPAVTAMGTAPAE